jgi:hypothetical protein
MEQAREALKKLNVFAENTARMGLFREGRSLPASANRAWSERHESFAFRLHPAGCWLRFLGRRTADSEMKPPGGRLDRVKSLNPKSLNPKSLNPKSLNPKPRFVDQRVGGQGAWWTTNVKRELG